VIHITFARDLVLGGKSIQQVTKTLAQKVTAIGDRGHSASRSGEGQSYRQRGIPMPILMMGLVALLVFGLIGFLLAAAVILEQSKHKKTSKRGAENAVTTSIAPSLPLHPKL
jgi:hypothetical protein